MAHVGDAGQAKPHLEHNPLSLLGICNATPMRKLNDPAHAVFIAVPPDGGGPAFKDEPASFTTQLKWEEFGHCSKDSGSCISPAFLV